MSFSIAEEMAKQLGRVSESDTGQEQIIYIDLFLLDEDKDNFYTLSAVPDLASNIQVCGLQQPIRVRKGEAGRYTIVSGHRRRAALVQLVKEGHKEFSRVPCIVETGQVSDAMRELRLIFANSATREMTSGEKAKQAERVEMLLYRLKEEGVEFPGRMRDQVAAACKASSTKIAVWKVIRENLIEEYMPLYEKGKINESAAYALAKNNPDVQRKVYAACKEKVVGAYAEFALKQVQEGKRTYNVCLTCPDGRSCTHGAAFLRHDMSNYPGSQCGGEVCCLNCGQATGAYYPCSNMCSKAQAARKAKADKEKEAQEKKAAKERSRRAKAAVNAAQRILKAVDAAKLEDGARLKGRYSYDYFSVKDLRDFVAGDDAAIDIGSSGDPFRQYYTEDLLKSAEILHCSTDYLLGLTDNLLPPAQPEGQLMICGWMPGGTTPREPCLCACMMDLGGDSPVVKVLWWDGYGWLFKKMGQEVQLEPMAWLALPEYEGGIANAES